MPLRGYPVRVPSACGAGTYVCLPVEHVCLCGQWGALRVGVRVCVCVVRHRPLHVECVSKGSE